MKNICVASGNGHWSDWWSCLFASFNYIHILNAKSTIVDLGQKNEKWDFNLAYVVHLYTYQVRLNAKIIA